MTSKEYEQIDERIEKVSFLSKPDKTWVKGKTIDPQNWGGLDLDKTKINLNLQQEILESATATDAAQAWEQHPQPPGQQTYNSDSVRQPVVDSSDDLGNESGNAWGKMNPLEKIY